MATFVKILEGEGVARVLSGTPGMTFVVDHFTPGLRGPVAHVRDYRYPRPDNGSAFQMWSIANGGYEILELPAEPREGDRVRIKETGQVGEWAQTRNVGPEGERLTILTPVTPGTAMVPASPGVTFVTVPPGYVPEQFIEAVAA